ncbi:DNA-directed RNA polymerase II subunit RPB1 [Fulvia fulva]|uniref:DNA-directed RNA polymerase II subunit RPB1 n=1 Tax=Passalora fulva TaxID=5499 RepID=A0A9Q8PJG3_PASFU|nr:DNA-directed RNA polymerase II subunit RPB1 [Fulvia fulva]KAK4611669.1 DNA-directed RNA polymerase II subunit RPB1 [Fulvia fulva]UJO23598.1 DNA-directed RNA polymerase II subunit RPB1 [Fulvia fulva]WPV21350.1 DNA-directed RNA polymerase II subunit RPB1 [Fulvia fulva]WPV35895.1 DNA-directed RNA polymerase II subunit RPB1 [Fulvia fulva]
MDKALQDARTHTATLKTHLDRLWKIIPPAKHVSEESAAKAQQVFDTPELLEDIISYLNTPGKLKVMGVQRTWRNTILGSTRLQKAIGLLPYDDGIYYSPFSKRFYGGTYSLLNQRNFGWGLGGNNMPGGTYDDSNGNFRWDEDSEYSFWTINHMPVTEDPTKLEINIEWTTSMKLGSRIESMLICDPPVKNISAMTRCAYNCDQVGNSYHPSRARYGLTSSSSVGFTLGELHQVSKEIIAKHPNCRCHGVIFETTVPLLKSDPVLIHRRSLEQRAHEKRILRREKRRLRREEESARDREAQQALVQEEVERYPSHDHEAGYSDDEDLRLGYSNGPESEDDDKGDYEQRTSQERDHEQPSSPASRPQARLEFHRPQTQTISATGPDREALGPRRSAAPPQYSPTSPEYSPTSPGWQTRSPQYSPTSPQYSSASPQYSPTSPQYSLTSPALAPISPRYSATSPRHESSNEEEVEREHSTFRIFTEEELLDM